MDVEELNELTRERERNIEIERVREKTKICVTFAEN